MPFDNTPIETVVETDSVIKTLVGMRELIAKGWIQHDERLGDSYCLLGAYKAVATSPGRSKVFNCLGFGGIGHLTSWNDRGCRTHQSVLDRIDQAIAKRKQQI